MEVDISASIALENYTAKRYYQWKSKNKTSIYKTKARRAVVRITSYGFIKKLNKKNEKDRQIRIRFFRNKDSWVININRTKKEGITMQTYQGLHPFFQIILNKQLPQEIWDYSNNKKSYTFPVIIKFDLNEWKDISLHPSDFILKIEKQAKRLMKNSLKSNFKVDFISKGRNYDLELIGPKGTRFLIAISSNNKKSESRSKESRIQKAL